MDTPLKLELTVKQFVRLIQSLSRSQVAALRETIESGPEEVRRHLSEAIEEIWKSGNEVPEAATETVVAEEVVEYRAQEMASAIVLEFSFNVLLKVFLCKGLAELHRVLDDVEDWYLARRMDEVGDDELLSEEDARREYQYLLATSC